MKVVKTSRILKMLADDGWYIVHQRGSHRQFRHPEKKGKVTVNGKPSDDTWGAELRSIEKQSGLIFNSEEADIMEEVVISTSRTEKGYSGSCELLPGWVVAFSGDFSGFIEYVRESIDFFVDCAKEDKEEYPAVFDQSYNLVFKMDIQSILYCYDKILTRAALSRLTGINERQLGHYICGRSKPRPAQSGKIVNALHALGRELQAVCV